MVSFAAETIVQIGSFPITNSLIDTFIVDGFILGAVWKLRKISYVPSVLQNITEMIVEGFYGLTQSVSPKNAMRIFPYVATFFIFIILANWSGLLPGFVTVGVFRTVDGTKEFIPFLRAATSDINTTLGLALVSAVATHVMAIQVVGLKDYISRYISLNPIYLFVGILELVGEFTKIVSLSFRLFGNVFAGEVVISTISTIFAFLLPLPFYALEVIVGLVQALVFAMLTMTFMAILSTSHNEGGEH